jgi:hypothetical protein
VTVSNIEGHNMMPMDCERVREVIAPLLEILSWTLRETDFQRLHAVVRHWSEIELEAAMVCWLRKYNFMPTALDLQHIRRGREFALTVEQVIAESTPEKIAEFKALVAERNIRQRIH